MVCKTIIQRFKSARRLQKIQAVTGTPRRPLFLWPAATGYVPDAAHQVKRTTKKGRTNRPRLFLLRRKLGESVLPPGQTSQAEQTGAEQQHGGGFGNRCTTCGSDIPYVYRHIIQAKNDATLVRECIQPNIVDRIEAGHPGAGSTWRQDSRQRLRLEVRMDKSLWRFGATRPLEETGTLRNDLCR